MRKWMLVATPRSAVTLGIFVVSAWICSLTSGCSTFILTRTYHDAATERAVYTPIRATKIEEAYLDHDGVLTVAFSGWNCSRKMKPGTERRYLVRLQTKPPLATSGVTGVHRSRGLRKTLFDKAALEPPTRTPADAVMVPIHIVSVDDISRVSVGEFERTSWDDFASRQVGPGVWIGMDRLQILYVPSPENIEASPPVLFNSQGEYARTFPVLIYGYPVALPVLVAVDIVTLPIKAVVIVFFIATWDGSMF